MHPTLVLLLAVICVTNSICALWKHFPDDLGPIQGPALHLRKLSSANFEWRRFIVTVVLYMDPQVDYSGRSSRLIGWLAAVYGI